MNTAQKQKYYNDIFEIKADNRNAGYHFFDPSAMKFFNSRVSEQVWAGKYFISSEKGPDNNRAYSIRMINEDSNIKIVGKFQEFSTRSQAVAQIKNLMRKEKK